MSSQVGNTSTPGHNWFEQGVSTPPNQVATSFTMPSGGGLITNLHAYFSLVSGGSATAWCCLWDSGHTLIANVPVSVPNGSASVGGQGWRTAALGTPVYVAGGATIYLGFSVSESNGFYSTDNGSGSSVWNTDATPPGNLSSLSSTPYNSIGAFADYLPVSIRVRRGGAWVQTGEVHVLRSGVQTQATRLAVRRSGAWVDAT